MLSHFPAKNIIEAGASLGMDGDLPRYTVQCLLCLPILSHQVHAPFSNYAESGANSHLNNLPAMQS